MEEENQLFSKIKDSMRALLIIILTTISVSLWSQETSNLKIIITEIPETGIPIYVAVHDSEAGFKNKKKPARSKVVVPDETIIEFVFTNIENGEYAIALFQDINGNKKLDAGMLKIPKEPFGISNYTSGIMFSAPTFDKAKINIKQDTTISIPMLTIFEVTKTSKIEQEEE